MWRPRAKLPAPAREALAGVYPSKARPTLPWEARRADSDYGVPDEPDWRGVDWRAHVRRERVAGREVSFVDYGEGDDEPVLFIHGLGANWQSWLENIPRAAADGRRVVAPDLPGFGRSEMPADRISISGYGRIVEELCQRLELDACVVVGNSMGGFIGAEIAVSWPARVERLVLAAAAGISTTNAHRRPILTGARVATALGTFAASHSHDVVARPRLRHLLLSSIFRHPTRLRPDILLEAVEGGGRPGFRPALDALLSYDFTDRLPEIGCPTLLIWGAEDVLVPVEDADEFARLIPDARKVIFDDTGHVPMIERPREFNECLIRFMQERGGARGARGGGGPAADRPAGADGGGEGARPALRR